MDVSFVNYQIITVQGKIISYQNNIKSNSFTLDLSKETKGVYFIKIYTDKSYKVYKIIKE